MAKCKNCINLDRQGWCEKVIDSPEPNRETDCYYFQHKTNADRIRAMSDEELADILNGKPCPVAKCPLPEKGYVSCRDCWLDFLRKEAKEDDC